ncbi:MAG: DUF262 domain-containing protein [Nitriliruptoraceae bacterium]
MSFQAPITIKAALDRMHRHDYVLPAIQREFVWDQDRIARLFDSLMRGYPIGSFLFWKIEPRQASDYAYYDFIRDFHRRDRTHCERLHVGADRQVTAILDGQQRLTSLNIGLAGSFAEKLPRLWWNNPNAYPKSHLYLDLAHQPDADDDLKYRFAFLTEKQRADRPGTWFKVGDILGMAGMTGMMSWLAQHEVGSNERAASRLGRLHEIVHTDLTVNYFEEEDQDIDRVLDIFIRVNSAGMVLSQSDLLLSIATAQWSERDARQEIHELVDELNGVHHGFDFSKDLVLKTGLVLTDAGDIRFRVQNFHRANMERLEAEWPQIAQALMTATQLLARFGFSSRTLPSDSILIPLADWLHRNGHDHRFVNGVAHREERDRIRNWVLRSLLKAGVFGSGLDTLLARWRRVIRENPGPKFPVEALEKEMATLGKSPTFDIEELEDLVELPFGNRRVFVLLALLYPGVDVNGDYHVDHIYPRKVFSKRTLRDAGLDAEQVEDYRTKVNLLPNLQLLEGPENQSKQAVLPHEWVADAISDDQHRHEYLDRHDLHELGSSVTDFAAFYDARRTRLMARLEDLLRQPGILHE